MLCKGVNLILQQKVRHSHPEPQLQGRGPDVSSIPYASVGTASLPIDLAARVEDQHDGAEKCEKPQHTKVSKRC